MSERKTVLNSPCPLCGGVADALNKRFKEVEADNERLRTNIRTIRKAMRNGWEEMWKVTRNALYVTRIDHVARDQQGWKPCPSCGSENIVVECDLGDIRWVFCNDCLMGGDARRWNIRAGEDEVPEDEEEEK